MTNDREEFIHHSETSASSAPRWMNCNGSVQLIKSVEPETLDLVNEEAAKGTTVHKIVSDCLDRSIEPWDFRGDTIQTDGIDFVVDDDMVDSATMFTDYVRGKMEQYKDKNPILHIERTMSSILDEDAWGTADITIEVPGERIIIPDFKNGMIIVEPDSDQLKYYGVLAVENASQPLSDKNIVELVIIQPRMPHPKGFIRKYVTNFQELHTWAHEELFPKMELTKDKDAPLVIGSWCRYCPARLFCPALRKEAVDLPLGKEPSHLTAEELSSLAQKADVVAKFLKSLQDEIYRRVMNDETVPGFKLVTKISHRVWKKEVESALDEAFGDEAYQPTKVKTPPNIEKLGQSGKEFVKRWAFKPNTGYTVVPENDKRSAVKKQMDQYLDKVE